MTGHELEQRYDQAMPVEFEPVAARTPEIVDDGVERARRSRIRWRVACGLAGALAIASFWIVVHAMVYEARGSVMIRPPDPEAPHAVGSALQAEVEILRSSEVLRRALESIGIEALYPGLAGETIGAVRAAALDRMSAALAARTLPESSVIEVRFRHADAELAADVVNKLVERYRRSRPDVLAPVWSERFLTDRIAAQRERLAAAEGALARFRSEHPELSDATLAGRRAALEAERFAVREEADAILAAGSARDPSVARAQARLDALELARQETLGTHVEGSRAMAAVDDEIARVRAYLAAKERAATPEAARRLDLLRARDTELEVSLAALASEEQARPELERSARMLTGERDVAARRLDAYRRTLEAARLEAEVGLHESTVAVRVLEAAEVPTTLIVPEAPARSAWALLGTALALVLGAFLLDVLDQPRVDRAPELWAARVAPVGRSLPPMADEPNERDKPLTCEIAAGSV